MYQDRKDDSSTMTFGDCTVVNDKLQEQMQSDDGVIAPFLRISLRPRHLYPKSSIELPGSRLLPASAGMILYVISLERSR